MSISKNSKLKEKYFGYLEGIIYVLLTIIIVFASVTGPILIKSLPLIFILGIVGRVIFNRPIITSIFGFLVSLCTIYIIGTYSATYNLMYSLFCFISILAGEVGGMYLARLMDKTKSKKDYMNIKYIIAIILIASAGIYLNNYVNGSIYSYLKAKQTLEKHISLNYSNSEYVKITNSKYVFNKYKYYSFNVKNIEAGDFKTYKFAVYSDSEVIDGYEKEKIDEVSVMIKNKFSSEIDLSKYINFEFDIKYSDLKNNATIYITKSVENINSGELEIFAEDINNILNDISNFDEFYNINRINICIKDKINKSDAQIDSTNFHNKEYYIDSLETEYLDR